MAGPRNRRKEPAYYLQDFEEERISKQKGKEIEKRLNGVEESNKTTFNKIIGGEVSRVKGRNANQRLFLDVIDKNEIIICKGPAGCGKSYLSVHKALELLSDKTNNYEKIIIITPIVEADEKLGFLPGDLTAKTDPYTFSTFHLMEKVIGAPALKQLKDKKIVEVMALAFLRGVNLDGVLVIAEEFQNSSIKQMKTLLTRIGEDSKFIISGDIEQSDRYKASKVHESGLSFAMSHVKKVLGVGTFEFNQEDIVRNPIISKILDAFKEQDQ